MIIVYGNPEIPFLLQGLQIQWTHTSLREKLALKGTIYFSEHNSDRQQARIAIFVKRPTLPKEHWGFAEAGARRTNFEEQVCSYLTKLSLQPTSLSSEDYWDPGYSYIELHSRKKAGDVIWDIQNNWWGAKQTRSCFWWLPLQIFPWRY